MPNFKKVVALLCSATVLAASAAMPVFADDDAAVETLASGTYEGKTFYDEDFSGFAVDTKANMEDGAESSYKTSNGVTLACGTRNGGDYDTVGVKIAGDSTNGNCVNFYSSSSKSYNSGDSKKPRIELSWVDTVYNQIAVEFSAKFTNATSSVSVSDGSKAVTVSSSSPVDLSLNTWYDFTILSYPENKSYTLIIKDAEGNLIDISEGSGYLSGLTYIAGLGGSGIDAYVDNLKVYDFTFPRFAVENVERLTVGEKTKIATVTDYGTIDVTGDGFESDTTDGSIMVTPSDSASGTDVSVAISAAAANYSRSVGFTKKFSVNSEQGFAEESANDIDLVDYNSSTKNVTKTTENTLRASGSFNLPTEDRGAEISWESSDASVISISGSKATVTYPESATNVTLTATVNYGAGTTTKEFTLGVATAAENVESAAASLAISKDDNSNITAVSGTTVTTKGNFTVPTTYSGATLSWASSDSDILSIDADGTVHVYPSGDTATLTATLTTGDKTATKEFTVNLSAYHSEYEAAFAQAVDEAVNFYYVGDESCADIITEAKDGAVIYNDLYLPTTFDVTVGTGDSAKTYTMDHTWTISENNYINADGTLNVSDMDLHENVATIKHTIKYVKDGKTVMSQDKSYTVSVQFKPEDILKEITKLVEANYAIDSSSPERESATKAAQTAAIEKYTLSFIDTNRVKYDALYDANFSGISSSLSNGESITLNTTGFFGSTLSWSSSSSYLKVTTETSGTTKTAKATASSVSSDNSATLTCNISSGAAAAKTYTAKVTVEGTGKKSSGGGGGGGGGGSSSGGDTRNTGTGSVATGDFNNVTVTPEPSTTKVDPNPSGFTDLDDVSWALTAINNLYVNGVVNGKTSTLFYPNDSVTRAEFAKMLVLTFDIEIVDTDAPTFTDVPTSSWAFDYIEAAYNSGIILGFDDGSFAPNAEITRQDMAVMVYRAATAAGYTIEDKTEAVTFSDDNIIASYSKDAISSLQKANIISGLGDGSFGPLNTSTRAQACQIIYNVFNK